MAEEVGGGVIVSSPLLRDYIRQHYPRVEFTPLSYELPFLRSETGRIMLAWRGRMIGMWSTRTTIFSGIYWRASPKTLRK